MKNDERIRYSLERNQQINEREIERGRLKAERAAKKRGRRAVAGTAIGGGPKSRRARVSAPASASPFAYQHKYACRTGKHKGAPISPVAKIKYDFDLKNKTGVSRVEYKYVFAPSGTPGDALDPLRMAYACESREKRKDARMMAHDMIALPHQLSEAQRAELAREIAREISGRMSDVPVYLALHAPEPGQDQRNYHIHLSYPIRKVIPDEGKEGTFLLADKIDFEKQPKERQALGLEATNHNDLKALRGALAGLCADALNDAGVKDHNLIERWRWGYLPLNGLEEDTQLKRAIARGDKVFIEENGTREKQKHEGPGSRWLSSQSPSGEHNGQLTENDPLLLFQRKCVAAIRIAIEEADDWEAFRLSLAQQNISLEYHSAGGVVTGIRWRYGPPPRSGNGSGITCAGKEIGLSLPQLRQALIAKGVGFANKNPRYEYSLDASCFRAPAPAATAAEPVPPKPIQAHHSTPPEKDMQTPLQSTRPRPRLTDEQIKKAGELIDAGNAEAVAAIEKRAEEEAAKGKGKGRSGGRSGQQSPGKSAGATTAGGAGGGAGGATKKKKNLNDVLAAVRVLPPEQKAPTRAEEPVDRPLPPLTEEQRWRAQNHFLATPAGEKWANEVKALLAVNRRIEEHMQSDEPPETVGLFFKKQNPAHASWVRQLDNLKRQYAKLRTPQQLDKQAEDFYNAHSTRKWIAEQEAQESAQRKEWLIKEYLRLKSNRKGGHYRADMHLRQFIEAHREFVLEYEKEITQIEREEELQRQQQRPVQRVAGTSTAPRERPPKG